MLRFLAFAGYPLACHMAVVSDWAAISVLWLGGLLILAGSDVFRGRWLYWIAGAAVICVALFGAADLESMVLRMQPIVITGMLAILFGQTLLPERVPLIIRIAEIFRGPLPPDVAAYSYGLTVFWTALFVFLTLESVLLAIFGSAFWWSLFTNLINYLIIALAFALEYGIRRRVLSNVEHEPFIDYLTGLARVDYLKMK